MFSPGKTLTLFAVSGACCIGMLWANQDETKTTAPRDVVAIPPQPAGAALPGLATTISSEDHGLLDDPNTAYVVSRYNANSAVEQAFQRALKSYRDAKPDSAERRDARDRVAKSLSDLYDQQLANQEKQIAEMSERLEKLRAQVGKRRDAKARMVELKLELVLSQAEGLGWPDDGAMPIALPGSAGQSLFFPAAPPITYGIPGSADQNLFVPTAPIAVAPLAPLGPASPAAPNGNDARPSSGR